MSSSRAQRDLLNDPAFCRRDRDTGCQLPQPHCSHPRAFSSTGIPPAAPSPAPVCVSTRPWLHFCKANSFRSHQRRETRREFHRAGISFQRFSLQQPGFAQLLTAPFSPSSLGSEAQTQAVTYLMWSTEVCPRGSCYHQEGHCVIQTWMCPTFPAFCVDAPRILLRLGLQMLTGVSMVRIYALRSAHVIQHATQGLLPPSAASSPSTFDGKGWQRGTSPQAHV